MNEGSAGETVFEQGFGLPPTVVLILCYRRCRLLPLHCGRNLVLQRPRPQQLHLPLGDSSGTKGKIGLRQLPNVAANKPVTQLKYNK